MDTMENIVFVGFYCHVRVLFAQVTFSIGDLSTQEFDHESGCPQCGGIKMPPFVGLIYKL